LESIFKVGPFTNRFLLWGSVAEIIMFAALVYVSPLAKAFEHGPIRLWPDWAFLFMLTPVLLIADEIRKFFVRRKLARDDSPGNDRSEDAPARSFSGALEEEAA
jgi:magnesium-transporting ATPase (P-type)